MYCSREVNISFEQHFTCTGGDPLPPAEPTREGIRSRQHHSTVILKRIRAREGHVQTANRGRWTALCAASIAALVFTGCAPVVTGGTTPAGSAEITPGTTETTPETTPETAEEKAETTVINTVLGELFREGRSALHVTGSSALTGTLRKVAGHRNRRVQNLFGYFNQLGAVERNALDVLIADEAHRIRETSASRFTRREARTGRPQVDELLDAARVPVFLLDEHQVVRPGENGSVGAITEAAEQRGLDVHVVGLDAQFRSGGSRAYEEWVLPLLGLADGGPMPRQGDDNYQLLVADSPEDLEGLLRGKLAAGYGARMSAGFCWPWSDAERGEPLVDVVRIGDWARPWNNPEERRHGDAPPRSLWATEPGGFDQIGCVYTAQGFEYDWSGVILGPEI